MNSSRGSSRPACSAVLRVRAAVCLLPIIFSGCSDGRPERVPVAGVVLLNSKPLARGVIRFVPSEGRPASGLIDEQGRFSLTTYESKDGVMPGVHRVEVTANKLIGDTKIRWHAPKKYSNRKTSGLTQEITGPIDNLVVQLSWEGGRPFEEPQ
jgi:hypothetical protein